jgi:hypothetical protein
VFTPVGDLARASHVLPFDPGGGLPGLLLSGFVQCRHDQRLVAQVLGHETAHHALGRIVVPHGVVEQSLHPIRRGIPSVLGQRPPVLARQVADQPGHVLLGPRERFLPREARRQSLVHHGQIRYRSFTLYDDSRSRLTVFLRHTLIIARRLPS